MKSRKLLIVLLALFALAGHIAACEVHIDIGSCDEAAKCTPGAVVAKGTMRDLYLWRTVEGAIEGGKIKLTLTPNGKLKIWDNAGKTGTPLIWYNDASDKQLTKEWAQELISTDPNSPTHLYIEGVDSGLQSVLVFKWLNEQSPEPSDEARVSVIKISSVTVTNGATQQNVTGEKSWATCLRTDDLTRVRVQATLNPVVPGVSYMVYDDETLITWTGALYHSNRQDSAEVETCNSECIRAEATCGTSSDYVDVWVIWVDVTIAVAGDLDPDCKTQNANPTGPWVAILGGGNKLGPEDHDANASLTYAYAIGKIQATGVITPAGAENVISKTAWGWVRTKEKLAYDNGGHYVGGVWMAGPSDSQPPGTPDGPSPVNSSLDPTQTGGKIFNLDAPGCSNVLNGITIYHNSEVYDNFDQYATVTLDAAVRCSDVKQWQYQAQVDVDLAAGQRIVKNNVNTGHTALPTGPHFPGTLSISGKITLGGNGLAGVTVTAGGRTATTDNNGDYTITQLPSETHTVTPTKQGTTFAPASQDVTLTNQDATGKDFTATQP